MCRGDMILREWEENVSFTCVYFYQSIPNDKLHNKGYLTCGLLYKSLYTLQQLDELRSVPESVVRPHGSDFCDGASVTAARILHGPKSFT